MSPENKRLNKKKKTNNKVKMMALALECRFKGKYCESYVIGHKTNREIGIVLCEALEN